MEFKEAIMAGKAKGRDPRSTDELLRLARAEKDADTRSELASILCWRNTREVLDGALQLCEGAAASDRSLGADILGELGVGEETFYEECFGGLLRLLGDRRVTVLEAAAFGLYHMHGLSSMFARKGRDDLRVVGPVAALKDHSSARVRFAAVSGLMGLPDDGAIQALVELSEDPVTRVRDWATFALGSAIEEVDTPGIRDALFRRVHDPDFDTRSEALVGLARRHDPRVLEPLREMLEGDEAGLLALEAAETLADSRLLGALSGLRARMEADEEDPWDHALDAAIAACRAGQAD
ncbi:MAG TPA: HEAT repeat domain-containing protein [Armatimonadota bacterium]|jgi:HEAT repeat protein